MRESSNTGLAKYKDDPNESRTSTMEKNNLSAYMGDHSFGADQSNDLIEDAHEVSLDHDTSTNMQ